MGESRTPQSWHRVEELLDQVLELAPTQRAAFIENLSDTDALFKPRLEELLVSSDKADELLEQPLLTSATGVEPGSAIGPYRVVKEVGHGGMGEVFEAQRDDGAYDMTVAIKLLRPGREAEHLVERFLAERQILAALVHPNIARMLDGGADAEGRPYLVMELIEGQQIDAYCDAKQLSIRQRLRLFRQVCDAVAFAHRHSVVHRDIKPSNILVTHDGQPKLLDFGIARIMDGAAPTEESQPRTPQYASPEQFGSGAVTTSTDVFSLGIVLYELITGHPFRDQVGLGVPEDSKKKPSLVVQETITARSKVITPISVSAQRQLSPERLSGRLTGDLDSIVLRTLEGKPEDRYQSVEQLSEDLKRHLAHRPVEARRDEPLYRLRRLAYFYRTPLAVTALCFFLALVGAMGLYRSHVEKEYNEEFTELAIDLFQMRAPVAPGRPIAAQTLLQRSVDSMQLDGEQSPLFGIIGNFYVGLGEYEKAAPILRRSLQITDSKHPLWIYYTLDLNLVENIMSTNGQHIDTNLPPHPLNGHPEVQVDSCFDPGNERQVDIEDLNLISTGDFDGEALVDYLNGRAAGLYQRGCYGLSIPFYRSALQVAERIGSPASDLDIIKNNLATSFERKGDAAEAIRLSHEVLASRELREGPKSPAVVASLRSLSIALQGSPDLSGLEAATKFAQRAQKIEAQLNGGSASAMTLTTVATAQRLQLNFMSPQDPQRQQTLVEARRLFDQSLNMARNANNARGQAANLMGLAILASEEGNFAVAEAQAQEALKHYEGVYAKNHWRVAEAESILGEALFGQGGPEKSPRGLELLERSLETLLTVRGPLARPTLAAKRRLSEATGN